MPGVPGVTVVTMLVCFFILHARLRVHRAPGIPCALSFGPNDSCTTRAHRAAGSSRCVLPSSRGAEATKRSSFLLRGSMDCFAPLVMTEMRTSPRLRGEVGDGAKQSLRVRGTIRESEPA